MSFTLRAVLSLPLALGAWLAAREIAVVRGSVPSRCLLPAVNANALLLRADSEPDSAARLDLLRAALAANGRSTAARIRLGLELEQARDQAGAEQALLEAARLDRQWLPAWTLANFYFRRDDQKEFWKWAARAAALTYDDYRPLLILADQVEPEPEKLLAELQAGPPATRAYLDFVIGQQRMDAARQVARVLARFNDPADRGRILALAPR